MGNAGMSHKRSFMAGPVQLDYTPTPRQPTWGFCVRLDQEIEFLDIYQ